MSEEKQFDYENDKEPIIKAYQFHNDDEIFFELVQGESDTKRVWMDETANKFAYRCLPLLAANSLGWQIKIKSAFMVFWNGGMGLNDVTLKFPSESKRPSGSVLSHFGSGILTFSIPWLFKTSKGHNLFITGPINEPKNGITPLSGLVETDWLPFTFTMNWKITATNTPIAFYPGDTICQFFPYPRGYIEKFKAHKDSIKNHKEINEEYMEWATSRNEINKQIKDQTINQDTRKKLWEKTYFRGEYKDGEKFEEHQIKINSCPFLNMFKPKE